MTDTMAALLYLAGFAALGCFLLATLAWLAGE